MNEHNQLPEVPRGTLISESWRYFRRNFAKENYSRFQGRAGRFEYWSVTIIGTLFSFLPFVLFPILGYLFILIELALVIYLAMPMLSVFVRRLHDVNFSGWWISFYYSLFSIVFAYTVFNVAQEILVYDIAAQDSDLQVLRVNNSCVHFIRIMVDFFSIFFFVLTLLPGTKGVNKYGEPV